MQKYSKEPSTTVSNPERSKLDNSNKMKKSVTIKV
jgi:hypothetical protein